MEYLVIFNWDEDAGVWTATSEDIPGLVLEGGSVDALIERVRYAAPELLEMNGISKTGTLCFQINRKVPVLA